MVTICTASLTFSSSTFCPHSVFMCFVWISEQTAIISLYNINWLVFITETHCVYCAVRPGYLNVIQVNYILKYYVSCTNQWLTNKYLTLDLTTDYFNKHLTGPLFTWTVARTQPNSGKRNLDPAVTQFVGQYKRNCAVLAWEKWARVL